MWLPRQVGIGNGTTQTSTYGRQTVQMPILYTNFQVEGRSYSTCWKWVLIGFGVFGTKDFGFRLGLAFCQQNPPRRLHVLTVSHLNDQSMFLCGARQAEKIEVWFMRLLLFCSHLEHPVFKYSIRISWHRKKIYKLWLASTSSINSPNFASHAIVMTLVVFSPLVLRNPHKPRSSMQIVEVHGITVVSKYSRSKTFDDDPSVMRTLKEQHGFVHENEGDVVGWDFLN